MKHVTTKHEIAMQFYYYENNTYGTQEIKIEKINHYKAESTQCK